MYGPDRVVAKVGDVRTKENLLTGRRPYKATAEIQIQWYKCHTSRSGKTSQTDSRHPIDVTNRLKGDKEILSNIQLYRKFEDELEPKGIEWDATCDGHDMIMDTYEK